MNKVTYSAVSFLFFVEVFVFVWWFEMYVKK